METFYVSAADELLKGEDDNPSIGITTPLGVASYQLKEVYERTMLEIKQQAMDGKPEK